jgi:catechol 2,3-dioxygenase-like lactoylglutathione lyase family enzyme
MNPVRKTLIGGVYDIGVGTSNVDEAVAFWQSCGYRVGPRGALGAAEARALYGVDSALTSVRLLHQNATAGLIRLMRWDRPSGPGLQMAPLRTNGNRWSVHRTDNIANAFVHGEILRRQGKPIHLVGPSYNLDLGKKEALKKPFRETIAASGDVLLFQPEAQLVAMTRMNYAVPKYGTINPDCPLRLSEGCHMAIVLQGDDLSVFDFYDYVLGFKRYHRVDIGYRPGYMPSDMFQLAPDESFTEVDFDDPEAGDDPTEHLPGRLRCFLFRSPRPPDDRLARAQPGHLGYSLFTARVGDLSAMHQRVMASKATRTTPILADEFGQSAFSFVAPDGFAWTLIQA